MQPTGSNFDCGIQVQSRGSKRMAYRRCSTLLTARYARRGSTVSPRDDYIASLDEARFLYSVPELPRPMFLASRAIVAAGPTTRCLIARRNNAFARMRFASGGEIAS